MKRKITYLNTLLTIIAIALTILILQNAQIIQPVGAQPNLMPHSSPVNIVGIGGVPVMEFGVLPVKIER